MGIGVIVKDHEGRRSIGSIDNSHTMSNTISLFCVTFMSF